MPYNRFRSQFFKITVTLILICGVMPPLHAQEAASLVIRMNGHNYPQNQDLVKRSLQEYLDLALDTSSLDSLIDTLAQEFEVSIIEYNIPDSVNVNYLVDESGENDFEINITQDTWFIQAEGFGCVFDIKISDFEFKLSGTSEFSTGQFNVLLNEPQIADPTISVTGSGNLLCGLVAAGIKDAIVLQIDTLVMILRDSLDAESTADLFAFLNPFAFLEVEDSDLVAAAVKSFPMNMRLITEENSAEEIIQLIVDIDFLLGTTTDSTAFVGIEPDEPDGAYLDAGGFSFLYWVLQQGYRWHEEWDESQRVNKAFTVMADNQISGYRVELRWSDVQKQAYTGSELNPEDITPENVDEFIAQSMFWDTTAFADMRQYLEQGKQNHLIPFMALGVGHEDRVPLIAEGQRIAPASESWQPLENFTPVSANEYLYNLKIFAHATVRRFADYINVWQIENELNAAGFAAAIPTWWRKGDLWQDEEFRIQVWDVLVTAVRTEDPTALITHDLHMLGFMEGLENWIEDMDIVGVNFYPNQVTALPNLGFAVGEYVWAVRRALKGLEETKPVWVIETGFPGIEQEDAPASLLVNDDLFYFSEHRQTEYVNDALITAVENGARGFFYYCLTTPEDSLTERADTRFMRYSGMIRGATDQQKPALLNFSNLLGTYLVTNISESNLNIPGNLSLLQNYPNPFNPATTIRFVLPVAQDVSITVFDALGRKLNVLADDYYSAGAHDITWDASDYASGVYFYQITAGKQSLIRKLVLLK